jgi:integrase
MGSVARHPVNRVSAEDLDRLYDELLRGGGRSGIGPAPGTVRKVPMMLSLVFAQAVRRCWIGKNPAEHASPPKARAPEPSPPDVLIVKQLLDEVDATSSDGDVRWSSFLRVAVATMRRRGELCGLGWSEVDLDKAAVSIFRVVKLDRAGAGLVVADFPKSARRTLARQLAWASSSVVQARGHRGSEKRALGSTMRRTEGSLR